MTEGKHVAMEKHICEVCAQPYDSGAVLLHKQLKAIPEDRTVTGWGLCPEHKEMHGKGMVALVEADPKLSKALPNGNLGHDGAYRTGRVMHMTYEQASHIFNTEFNVDMPMVYIEPEAFDKIARMAQEAGVWVAEEGDATQ